jgi:hypothetical protein
MANFEHACFISYKHPPKSARERHFYREFVEAFRERLEFYLSTPIRSYVDIDADPGSSYPVELAQTLCKSVCMIAILVPEYPDSNWCWAEWQAMEKLEAVRLNGGRGLIIPIALRRTADEWNALLKRKPVDFSKVAVPKVQLHGVKHSQKIRDIAIMIQKFVAQVQTCDNCTDFKFSVGEEQLNIQPTFSDPNPLA